jgi:enoyl-CoA hydratase
MPFEIQVDDHVAELVFNHTPVNAFTGAMWMELPGLITSLGQRQDVRCILIRAEGRGFCAGVDIKELAENSNAIVEVNKGNFLTYKAIHDCEIPVVAAPHSFVLGGGGDNAGSAR